MSVEEEGKMNGVAKQFWSEVRDLKSPVDDDGGRARRAKARKKLTRRVASRTARQTASAA